MEVHHHAHTEPKKFKHYLWEFLMLFFAVTLGFFVENLREKTIEHHRGRQYILSITEDIKFDIHNLDSITLKRQQRGVIIDSLIQMLNSPDPDQYGKEIYYYARWLTYYVQFINDDRTIQQLKNSGNFRLIENQEVSNRIMSYFDEEIRWIDPTNKREELFIENYILTLQELFDNNVFDKMLDPKYGFHMPDGNPHLLSKEKNKLQKLLGSIHFLKSINIFLMNWQNNYKTKAQSLLEFIKKEYHLE
ncbi:MAG TPA: hypothetical protein VG676_11230 [Chitinophagaceae bacterium]|jgi:hypothetical protein|nr:hypothetical protein [Chitinophagaceae bacterium]